MTRTVLAIGLCGLLVAAPARAQSDFSVPASLQPQVDFWVAIFAKYGKHQVVIHDTDHLDRVYSVVDFSDLESAGASETQIELAMGEQEDLEKARVRGLLRHLDEVDPASTALTPEEQRIVALFASDRSPTKFAEAAAVDRVRGQRGLRERFAHGIEIGHAYFPHMEAIFRMEGVPPELTRLPLIESCFNIGAYSKVGAAGVWQFMPGTARNFMRVDDAVDERLDPIIAGRAAARFLRHSYDDLGTWPLAITSYNHGPAGVARAVRDTGTTDIATIIRNYHGPAFKFASRNFYPEFLAALEVESHYRHYFGELALQPALSADTVYLTQHTALNTAARCAGAEPWELAALNPSLLPVVHSGRRPIPPGVELRVPSGARERFHRCFESIPPVQLSERSTKVKGGAQPARVRRGNQLAQNRVVHKVKPGQTLSQIAERYGCSVEEIRRGNRLHGNAVRPGQLLQIPQS